MLIVSQARFEITLTGGIMEYSASYYAIEQIDLEPIKAKLIDTREGKGWTLERANRTERLYKRFLYLCHIYGRTHPIVPTPDIDEMWHQHILDTRKYSDDCERVFGYFVHHYPYFGMRGDSDAAALQDAFGRTIELYNQHFPEVEEPYVEVSGARCSSCANACYGSGGNLPQFATRPTIAMVLAASA